MYIWPAEFNGFHKTLGILRAAFAIRHPGISWQILKKILAIFWSIFVTRQPGISRQILKKVLAILWATFVTRQPGIAWHILGEFRKAAAATSYSHPQSQPAATASSHSQSYSQSHTHNHIEQRREEEVAKRGSRGGTARERKERGKRERGKKGGTELVVPNPCCQKVNQQSSTSTTIPHSKPRFQKRVPLENKPSIQPPLGPAVAVVCCGCASCGN